MAIISIPNTFSAGATFPNIVFFPEVLIPPEAAC